MGGKIDEGASVTGEDGAVFLAIYLQLPGVPFLTKERSNSSKLLSLKGFLFPSYQELLQSKINSLALWDRSVMICFFSL